MSFVPISRNQTLEFSAQVEKDRDDFDALVARINAHASVNWSEGGGGMETMSENLSREQWGQRGWKSVEITTRGLFLPIVLPD